MNDSVFLILNHGVQKEVCNIFAAHTGLSDRGAINLAEMQAANISQGLDDVRLKNMLALAALNYCLTRQ